MITWALRILTLLCAASAFAANAQPLIAGGPVRDAGLVGDDLIFADRSGVIPLTFPGDFPCDTTLQACIDYSAAGGVIEIATSAPIMESLTIKKSLTLRGTPGIKNVIVGSIFLRSTDAPASIVVSDLNIQGQMRASPSTGALDVVIADNTVMYSSPHRAAIMVRSGTSPPYGDVHAEILRNTVTTTGSGDSARCGGIAIGGFLGVGSSSVRIVGNHVEVNDCGSGDGISARPGGHALSTDVIGNFVSVPGTTNGIMLSGQDSSHDTPHTARVINNLVSGQINVSGQSGALVVYAGGSGQRIEVDIVNNTVVYNQTGLKLRVRTDADVTGVVANNIVAFHTGTGLEIDPDLADVSNRNNLVFENASDNFTPGPGSVVADPRLIAAGPFRFRLAADSPAINAGSNAQVPTDISTDGDGLPRIAAGIVDIGAFEVPPPNIFQDRFEQ